MAARLEKHSEAQRSQKRLEVPNQPVAVKTIKPLGPIKITRDNKKFPQLRAKSYGKRYAALVEAEFRTQNASLQGRYDTTDNPLTSFASL